MVAEYEMKLKLLETEMEHFRKSLSSNQDLLHFSISKNKQLVDEVRTFIIILKDKIMTTACIFRELDWWAET